ncbi:MAG: phage major capsid protein [Cetobacterium sp.]
MSLPPVLVWRAGRTFHQVDGRLLPVVRGGDGPLTTQNLADERGRVFARMEDLISTARQDGDRALTDTERAEFDQAEAEFDRLTGEIDTAAGRERDGERAATLDRYRSVNVPSVNRITDGEPVTANRSLDELLWATSEDVPAGTYDRTGTFRQHFTARASVEQVAVRSQDGDGVLAPRISDFRPEHRQTVRSFQGLVADMALFGMLVDRSATNTADGFRVARSHRAYASRWQQTMRALDTDTAAEGLEWIPTGIGASLHERIRAAGRIAGLFSRIDLPTNPWKWPLEGADATAFRVAEPTSDTATKVTASTPGTGAVTFDAEIFGGRILTSRSLEADSAIAILPYMQRKLVQAFVDAEEKAILDGDTDGAHQDSDVGASTTDARTAWDGLRKRALANAATAGTNVALTVANLGAVRATMAKYGLSPSDLVFICGVSSYHDLILDPAVLTIDKLGAQATILNGQLASVYGIPIIVSEHVRENLNASGVFDNTTTNRTYALAVNRSEWVMGQRMALDVEVDDSIYRESFQRVMVGFMREDFQNVNATGSTEDDTAIIFNVAP